MTAGATCPPSRAACQTAGVLLCPPVSPVTASDEAIRAAVADGVVAALLPAVAQLTGEHSLLREDLRPDADNILDPQAGLSDSQMAEARQIAFEALIRWRDAGCPAPATPTEEELRELMAFAVGEANVAEYYEVLSEELAIDGADLRAPGWQADDIAPGTDFPVAIVGAGMSGILAAHRLAQAGIEFTVFEKNEDVGGTWFENTYPGCRVDVPNHLYSYSFAPSVWPEHFSSQEVLLDYFRSCADILGLREHIRFGVEVLSAELDEQSRSWTVHVRDAHGKEERHEFAAVISAVGQLNRPSYPDIPGCDSFEGPAFHSARWDHEVDLRNKRVAVIGTGASAMQLIPAIADEAAELVVFQRTPAWLVPTPEYHDEVPDGMRWLLDHVPGYGQWFRLWLFWRTHEGLLIAAKVDPEWPQQGGSVSAINEMVRHVLTEHLRAEFADAPDLIERVIPDYPPIAKRVIRDNGIWARTLTRDDVHLVTEPIERITQSGVRTTDGAEHHADVLIYGTGFQASRFLTPMRVTGRNGVDLHEAWDGDARAYLGMTVPGFPNLFCLYGPNTNIVINGSIIYFSELEVRYIVESIRMLLERGHRLMDCRPEVHEAFNEEIDEANKAMAWGASSVNSWYKSPSGRVAQNWPFSLLEYWRRTREPDLDDYELL